MSTSRKSGKSESCTIGIGGLDCADCARKLEEAVAALDGVEKVNVNLFDSTLSAEGSGPHFSRERIADEIARLGHRPLPELNDSPIEEAAHKSVFGVLMVILPSC